MVYCSVNLWVTVECGNVLFLKVYDADVFI